MTMASGTSILIFLSLVATLCHARNFVHCPSHEGCKCDLSEIVCDCTTASSAFEMARKVVVSESTITTLKRLIIRNCEAVEISKYAMTNIDLENIEFSDIGNLSIYHLGINIAKNLDLIRFKNINRMLLGRFALAYLNNVNKFEIINVTSPGFPLTAFFEINDLKDFLIEDSDIGILQSHALTFQNGSTFTISNSKFNLFTNASIVLKNFQQFIIKDSSVKTWQANGIGSLNAGQIQIKGNTIEDAGKGFLYVSGAAEVIIKDNDFKVLQTGALDEIFKTSYISFVDNKIEEAKAESIGDYFNDTSSKMKLVSEGNEFKCGCGIEWIVLRMVGNKQFLRDNFCLSPFSNLRIRLSNLTFVNDPAGNCLSFVEPEFTKIVTTELAVQGGNGIPLMETDSSSSNTSKLSDHGVSIKPSGAEMASVNAFMAAILVGLCAAVNVL